MLILLGCEVGNTSKNNMITELNTLKPFDQTMFGLQLEPASKKIECRAERNSNSKSFFGPRNIVTSAPLLVNPGEKNRGATSATSVDLPSGGRFWSASVLGMANLWASQPPKTGWTPFALGVFFPLFFLRGIYETRFQARNELEIPFWG